MGNSITKIVATKRSDKDNDTESFHITGPVLRGSRQCRLSSSRSRFKSRLFRRHMLHLVLRLKFLELNSLTDSPRICSWSSPVLHDEIILHQNIRSAREPSMYVLLLKRILQRLVVLQNGELLLRQEVNSKLSLKEEDICSAKTPGERQVSIPNRWMLVRGVRDLLPKAARYERVVGRRLERAKAVSF